MNIPVKRQLIVAVFSFSDYNVGKILDKQFSGEQSRRNPPRIL